MPKSKLFTVIVLTLALLVTATWAVDRPIKNTQSDDRQVVQLTKPGRYLNTAPTRDEDDFMTFRYMVSTDGGVNWSEIRGAGDTGMWEVVRGDTVPAWGSASYDFGVVVGQNNSLHFVAVLNSYSDIRNPENRVNGVYDVRIGTNGNVRYLLIAAEPEDASFVWSDVGVDQQNNLYAIWVKVLQDDTAELWCAKSTDNGANWSDPLLLSNQLHPNSHYPHITYHVAEYFYVIYQVPNPDTGLFDHYVVKMASSMQGNPVVTQTEASSASEYSYYVGSVNAIDQDWNTGHVYFAVRSSDGTGVTVGNYNGGDWIVEQVTAAQRYPSIALDQRGNNGTPWLFSNYAVPAAGSYHKNWYSYDESGYNGGNWVVPPMPLDSVLFDGTRYLLYCHQGVWTSGGRLLSGCNVWGQYTPEGFQVTISDDGGANWRAPNMLWDIESGMRFGYIAQNTLLAGQNEYVFIAFNGQYGASDFTGPEIGNTTLSSFALNEPWIVTAELNDESGIGYTDVNWLWFGAEDWEYAEADSGGDPDNDYNGTFYYTMPSDTMNGHALANGDSIWFFIYAEDPGANYSSGWENLIVVGEGWAGVRREVQIPKETSLGTNYPNPFNNTTVIPFAVNRSQKVKLQVWDTNGRLVATLFDGRAIAGNHEVTWNGEGVSSGVYLYTLDTTQGRFVQKMTLIK